MNETQQAIIDYLRKHPLSTAREIAAATSYSISPVYETLALLRDKGAVIARRARHAWRYRLNPRWF